MTVSKEREAAFLLITEYKEGWKRLSCERCSGSGHIFDWTGELVTCNVCKGNTVVWKSPKGNFFRYPGGPFISI
jgi:hypothetical protein